MNNKEKVLAAISAGHDHLAAIVSATGLERDVIRSAIDHMRNKRMIMSTDSVRVDGRGRPQVRYKLADGVYCGSASEGVDDDGFPVVSGEKVVKRAIAAARRHPGVFGALME